MKLEDVEVGMKVVPHSKSTGSTFDEFNSTKSVHRKNDSWLYVYGIEDDGVIRLSPEINDGVQGTCFLPKDIEQWCNADDAPEGYYAVSGQSCSECAFYRKLECSNSLCFSADRKDSCNIIFKKKISCKEAFDEIDKLSVPVETVLGKSVNVEGTISTADPVNHPSHYTSGEIECIDAIKASMSKESFLGFLKGSIIKYCWRYEKKVNPAEDIKKAGWYRDRLEKELHDNSQNN